MAKYACAMVVVVAMMGFDGTEDDNYDSDHDYDSEEDEDDSSY